MRLRSRLCRTIQFLHTDPSPLGLYGPGFVSPQSHVGTGRGRLELFPKRTWTWKWLEHLVYIIWMGARILLVTQCIYLKPYKKKHVCDWMFVKICLRYDYSLKFVCLLWIVSNFLTTHWPWHTSMCVCPCQVRAGASISSKMLISDSQPFSVLTSSITYCMWRYVKKRLFMVISQLVILNTLLRSVASLWTTAVSEIQKCYQTMKLPDLECNVEPSRCIVLYRYILLTCALPAPVLTFQLLMCVNVKCQEQKRL